MCRPAMIRKQKMRKQLKQTKKTYTPPVLKKMGSVASLTLKGGSLSDGALSDRSV